MISDIASSAIAPMTSRRPFLVDSFRALLAAFGVAMLVSTTLAASSTAMAEPFRNWLKYAMACVHMAVIAGAILTIPIFVVTLGPVAALSVRRRQARFQAIVSGMLFSWRFLPIVIAWGAFAMMSPTYHPNFGFFSPTATPPPASLRSFIDAVGHPIWGVLLCAIAVYFMIKIGGQRYQQLKNLEQGCGSCGYPRAGLPIGASCPECGHAM